MSLLQVENLTFGYEGSYDLIFDKVSFILDTDWKSGFVGRNGRGKTTFLRILLGELEYSGKIIANADFAYFPYAVHDKSKITVDILSDLAPEAEDWEILREVSLLETESAALYRPFETLSGGERTKILLAALFLGDPRFLLIDEPTNHLDLSARAAVGNYLRKKKGFLLVSHDRELLDSCTDHTLAINKTNIEIVAGNFSAWWAQKQKRDSFEAAQNKRLAKEASAMREAAERNARWSDKVEASKIGEHVGDRGYVGHMAAKMMKRSKSAQTRMNRAAEEKSALLRNVESTFKLKITPLTHTGDTLINCNELTLFYGDKPVCAPLTFRVAQGEKIAVCGKNGSGKSTLLKFLAGEQISRTGEAHISTRLKISYVPQDTSRLSGGLRDYTDFFGIDESLFKAILHKLDFAREQFDKRIENYSEGQKKKVLLARSLCEQAHLYIWDEPLNYVDVFSRMQIEELLSDSRATMLFVEHDAAFREKIATGRLDMP